MGNALGLLPYRSAAAEGCEGGAEAGQAYGAWA